MLGISGMDSASFELTFKQLDESEGWMLIAMHPAFSNKEYPNAEL
ncbi:MAG: hypothetical protein RR574_05240 [Comamonas sp.]